MASVINDFLQECARRVRSGVHARPLPRLTAVLGNESGDLDSVVGAIYLSLYLRQNATLRIHNTVPVIQFPRSDLILRNDVHRLLRQHAIDHNLLISSIAEDAADDLYLDLNRVDEIVLYDHNALAKEQQHLHSRVVGVVDHHVEECSKSKPPASKLHLIATVGSACTLVARLYHDSNTSVPLPQLLAAPIILDTVNFNQAQRKVTDTDVLMYQWLRSLIQDANFSSDELFDQLVQWKADIFGLSIEQNLKRDYKHFAFAHSTATPSQVCQFGISSIPCTYNSLADYYGIEQLRAACEQYVYRHSLHVLLLLLAGTSNGAFSRDVVCFASGSALSVWTAYVQSVADDVTYTLIDSSTSKGGIQMLAYTISDPSLSRKRLVPSLAQFIHRAPSGL